MATDTQGSLYCRQGIESFQQGEVRELERYLERVERSTTVSPISDPEELMIGSDGATRRGGYRYTAISFRKIAQQLASGLSTLLPDMAGETLKRNVDEEMTDPHGAREIFNNLARLRFPLLRPYRLLRNEEAKTIDGVVGQKHRSLENLTMLESAASAVQSLASDVEFYAAAVVGRKMVLWYRATSPLFVREINGKPWRFRHGYYFRNSEVTGTSVRGGLTIYTRHGTCLSPFTKNSRVSHIGRDFNQRLSKMFQHILGADVSAEKFRDGVDRLLDTPLGYAELDEKERKRFKARFVRALGDLGLPQQWAKEIFNKTLSVGSVDLADLRPTMMRSRLYASRTFFDVFCPLVRMARDLPITRREAVEQVAYKVLTGKLVM